MGLIGAGNWGRRYIETLRDFPGAVLTRVASRNPETAALVGPGCAVSRDWREVIAARDLDGVILTSAPAFHAPQACAAIEAGLPVMIEKPLTLDLPSALGLLEGAQLRGSVVLIDHIYLYHPAYQELKRRARKLGQPRRIRSAGGNHGPFRESVSPLWDYGPHDLALCLDLVGRMPSGIDASRRTAGNGEIIDLELTFPGGPGASLTLGNGFKKKERRFTVVCDDGVIEFDDLREDKLTESISGRPAVAIPVESELPLDRALQAFVEAIHAGGRDLSQLRLAVEVIALLSRCETALSRERA